MNAAGYIRVSTDDQAREGYSLAAQERAIRDRCSAEGWELTGLYADEGLSGALWERPGLQRMLGNSDRFDVLVVWSQDRVSRDTLHWLTALSILAGAGCRVLSIQEGWIDSGPDGELLSTLRAGIATWERQRIRARISAGLAEKARQGHLIGLVPMGYRRNDGGVERDPTIAPLIRQMFDMAAAGAVPSDIAAWATGQGLRGARGAVLDRYAVYKMLRNPAYLGLTSHHRRRGGPTYPGRHAAIVDEQTFRAADVAIRRRALTPARPWRKTPYLLTGIARCASCGKPFSGFSRQGLRYFRCSTRLRRGQAACAQPMVPTQVAEAQVAAYLTGFQVPDSWIEAVWASFNQPGLAGGDGEVLQRRLARLKRLYLAGDLDWSAYQAEAESLKRQIAAVTAPALSAPSVIQVAEALRDFPTTWAVSPPEVQRRFVQETLAAVIVDGRQVTAIRPKAEVASLFLADRRARFGGIVGVISAPEATWSHAIQRDYIPVGDGRGGWYCIPALVAA